MLTGPWKHLKPLRIVLVKDDMDPLSLIMIPPHHGCDTGAPNLLAFLVQKYKY
jgi:hypothetical protein